MIFGYISLKEIYDNHDKLGVIVTPNKLKGDYSMEDIDGVIYDYIRTTKESFFSDYLFRFWLIRRTSSTIRNCITNVSTEGWCE